MSLDFNMATSLVHLAPGRFRAQTDASWQQGRGVFGGLLLALVARASAAHGPAHRLRSISMEFVAPVRSGDLFIEVQSERSGLLVARQSVRLLQDEKLVGLAMLSLAKERSMAEDFQEASMPKLPPIAEIPALPFVPPMPAFTQHFRYHHGLGGVPGFGSPSTHTGGWLCAPEVQGPGDTALIAAMLDAWFPAWLCRMGRLAQMATVSFHAHFMAPWGPRPGSSPVVIENTSDMANEGYATERNELWSADGRLLARSQQLVALLEG